MGLRLPRKVDAIAYPLLSAVVVLGFWVAMRKGGVVPEAVLPGPGQVLDAFREQLDDGRLVANLLASGQRLLAGFAIGATSGALLGISIGMFRLLRNALLPVVEILRPIPPLAWVPLALIWLGIGEASKIFLIALTVCFPVLIATMKAVEQIEPLLLRAAQSMDVSPRVMFARVVLPAIIPDLVTGLRLGWTLGITILVGAEMLAARSGLGYLVINGMNAGRFDQVILGILIIGTISVVTDAAFVALKNTRLLRWHAGLDRVIA